MRWYHGTSKQNAEKILKEGVLKPGEHSVYREDVPRYDAVYLTSDWQIAKYYSEERGKDGVVLEIAANESKLMPDEDSVYDALHEGAVSLGGKANKRLGQAIREEWFKYWKSIDGEGDTFEEAWEAWSNVEAEGSSGIAEEMKALTEEIHEKNPALSKAIIKASGKAAHIGPAKVVGIAKKAAKKVKLVKTPGFVIEVPQERRTKFFVRPKAPLEYWAFKNRPRVFINEPLIFTFGGKPVAQAVVVRVEAPGKGEGEYKHWHKVYWKPTSFKKFKVTAAENPKVLYHLSRRTNRQSILKSGLLPLLKEYKDIERAPGVYFFQSLAAAKDYGFFHAQFINQATDIWECRIPEGYKLYRDPHPEMAEFDAWMSHDVLPPKNLKVVDTILVSNSTEDAPPRYKGTKASLLKSAKVKLPTFEQVVSKDPNNEFNLVNDYEHGVADMWEDRSLNNMREYYDEVAPKLANLKFPLTVYRCYALKEGNKVDYKSLGSSWSLSSRAAYLASHEMFNDEEYEQHKVITGVLQSPDGVDWVNTVRAWMTLPEEQEIRLKPGAQVKVQGKVRTATSKKFYHGTKKKNLEDIMKNGLKVAMSEAHTEWNHAIYLACDVYTAANYEGMHGGGEPWVIFEIDGRKLNEYYMRPDDYDFPDLWAQEGREENWAHQTWQTSLKMSCQIAYLADIPASAIKVYEGKTRFASGDDSELKGDMTENPDYYMTEGCGIYAVDFARKNGGEIYVLAAERGDQWSEEIPYEVTHAFVKKDGKTYDIRGERTPDKMAWELSMGEYSVKGPWTPDAFEAKFMGDTDDKPLFGNTAALGDQHHHADDIPTPLRTVLKRPAVIDWYSDSPDVAGKPKLIDIDPKTLLTDQATVSKSHLDKILANINKINEPTPSTSEEHSAHPMVLGTSEGDFIFDGNHRCAAALMKDLTIKVLYLDLTPIEDRVPELYLGEEDGTGVKSAAAKLPKGWRVTIKGEAVPGSPYPYYWGHLWKDNQFYGTCGVGSEYRDKAREAAIDWAWQASGQERPKTAAEDTQTFYHGTTWEAAKDIDKTGIKANKWKFGPGKFVWVTIHPGQAYEYGQSISWHELDQPERSAVVEFEWPYKESEPDPEHEPHGDMYRRIPSDIPRSAIRKIQWFEKGKIVKTANLKSADHVNEEGYWAGEGNAASGVLAVCPSKGTVCFAWRSSEVMSPNCWGTIGGAVQKDMSPQQSAKKEMAEETGYSGGITLTPAYVFTDRGFSYHNFIGVVSNEFTFNPSEGFGWETDHIVWVPYQEALEDMQANPGDYHPGVLKLFANSKDVIERALKIKKTAWKEIAWSDKEGDLMGGILESAADLKAWASPSMDDELFAMYMEMFKRKRVAVIDAMNAWNPGQGKGTEMLERFIAEARAKNCDAIVLESGNAPNQFDIHAWYQEYGFRDFGTADGMPLMVKWLKPGKKKSADEEIIKSVTPEIDKPYIDEGEWQRINKWLISLQWRGRNPWYPEKFPWFCIRLFSDGWVASNDLMKETLAEGKDLASLKKYLSEFAKEYRTSLDALRTPPYKTLDMQTDALTKRGAFDPSWMKRWVEGDCWLFALALSHRMPDATFVGLEKKNVVHHVGLKKGDRYFDVRGEMEADEFNYGADADEPYEIVPMDYEQVMRDGEYSSWIGHEDEFNALPEMKQAEKAVRRVFGQRKDAAGVMESRQPCPSGKRKFYDERSAIGPHKKWDEGTPNLRAYQCPKCGWWHLTSKPQRQPVMAGEFDESNRLYEESVANEGKAPQNRGLYEGKPFWSGIADVADGSIIEVHTYEEAERGDFHHSFYVSHSSQQMMKEGDYAFFWIDEDGGRSAVQVEWPTANQDVKIPPDLAKRISSHIQFRKTAAAHTPEYAQKLIETLKQTVHEADFRVIGSVGAGGTSENDLDIMVDIHPNAAFDDDKAWIETSGLVGAMKLMGFDNIDTSEFSPEESVEKSETSGKYLDPQGSSIEKFFNPTTHHTVEFWFAESGMEKEADWKSKYVLPTALALTGLGVGAPPVHPGKATPQQIEQREQAETPVEQEKQPLDPADVTAALRTASKATGIPLAVLSAIAHNETSYGLDVSQGGSGSNGFMQMTPDALAEVNKVYGTDYIIEDMDDPDTAALAAAQYLHILLKKFSRNLDATIAAYNTGPAHVNKVLADYGEVTPETLAAAGHQLTSTYLQKAKARMAPKTGEWIKKAAGFVFKSFKKLWHVGTMNPKDKRDDSYEGAGLSVSVNPDEWQMIAKIGGDLWELTKAGNKFVNFHRLNKAQRKQIADWGIKNGYAQPASLWRHSWFDDELDDVRYSDYVTKEEAEAELGGYGGDEKVEPVKGGLTATPKLSQKSKRGKIDPLEVIDLLVTAYAEDELDCDGVWWADDLDPDNLSAPRGVIFPSKLSSWKKRKVQSAAKTAAEWKKLPPTAEWIQKAKLFLKDKWAERHKELQREGVPTDLKGACKFASLFAYKLFGGKMVGTAEHQALSLGGGTILDLTDLFNPNTFSHDKKFWMNPEHAESMKSVEPRVNQWVDEFFQKYWQDYFKTHTSAKEVYLYHGTNDERVPSILKDGMPAGSYWGTAEMADWFAKGASEEEGMPVIFRVPLSRFNTSALAIDNVAIQEPITEAIGRNEEELYAEWEAVPGEGTWQDSLRIYHSVKYNAPMKVTEKDLL